MSFDEIFDLTAGVYFNFYNNIMWFHLNHDMVSRRIYKLSFYEGRSIIVMSAGEVLEEEFSCLLPESCRIGLRGHGRGGKRRRGERSLVAAALS